MGVNIMPTKNKSEKYDRAEITFGKLNKLEQQIYNHLLEKSKIVGKGAYLKQLLYEDMIKNKKE
jgi:hypothetical protein